MFSVPTIRKPFAQCLRPLAAWMFIVLLFTLRAQAAEVPLIWNASASPGVAGYRISVGTKSRGYTSTKDVGNVTSNAVSGLTSGTAYYIAVQAYDSTKTNLSAYSNEVCTTVASNACTDGTVPSSPGNLVGVASSSGVNLSWSASTDNVSVTGYQVERCQGASCEDPIVIALATGTSYSDTGLTTSVTFRYAVRAIDAAGNLSSYSNIVNITTPSATDTTAPTVPDSFAAAAASETQVNVSWGASTDNVGVTGYRVERCEGSNCTSFTQIATPAGSMYPDTGLIASTTYRYRVRATDAAGNVSGYSTIANATTLTPSTPPPPPVSTSCTSNCTIWPSTAVPGTVDNGDAGAVELGLKFKADVPGRINGIRFYKGSANTGTHIGNLWTADGTKLASATFTNETSSGWQQVNFATPVTIAADTVYVASYFAPVGRYSIDQPGFNASVDNGPLHALSDSESGGNGVYAYGPSSSFPTQTWIASNYWVDVVFTPASSTGCTPNPATNGLVAAYGFEEVSDSMVLDQSGNCNTGTPSGATRVSNGKFGKALSFNGTSDWITVPDSSSLDVTTGLTIEAWVRPATTPSGWAGILYKEAPGGAVYELVANSGISSTTGPLAGISTTGNPWWETTSGKRLTVGVWTHVAMTYDRSTGMLRLYVNGNRLTSWLSSGTINTSDGALRIGGHSLWGQFFNGLIDEVRIYSRALSGTEIKDDMNRKVGP